MIWTLAFWRDSLDRAVRTAAQVVGAKLVVDDVAGAVAIDWAATGQYAAVASLASLLMAVGAAEVKQRVRQRREQSGVGT